MSTAAALAWALPAIVGNAALWVGLVNRIHAFALPRKLIKALSLVCHIAHVAIPVVAVWTVLPENPREIFSATSLAVPTAVRYYALFCCALAAWRTATWVYQRLDRRGASTLISSRRETLDVARRLGRRPVAGWKASMLARVPGNQFLRLEIAEKTVALAGLPSALDGLSVCHVSDLHFSGRVTREYFSEVVRAINALQADVIALTGDVCEHDRYIDWIADTLGGLESRHGKYFILGNHDTRVHDIPRLRRELASTGLIDVAGRWCSLEINGETVALAGNERPWFSSAAEGSDAPVGAAGHRSLKILLSHSPDQFGWARRHGFDLMLAGHTHGGQIRLPLVGPVACPSRFGVKYAAGLFYQRPTLLHVSRGVSSLLPLRLNCAPEITKLVLTKGTDTM